MPNWELEMALEWTLSSIYGLTEPKSIFTRQFRDYLDEEFLQKGLLYEQYFRDLSPKTSSEKGENHFNQPHQI